MNESCFWIALIALTGAPQMVLAQDLSGQTLEAQAKSSAPETEIDARIDLSHLFSADNQTDRHLNFTDLRGMLDAGWSDILIRFDGRGRLSWSDLRPSEEQITHLYLRYAIGSSGWAAAGRQTIADAGMARVDGAYAGMQLTQEFSAGLFGGLTPHPLTGDFNHEFYTAGLAYQLKGERASNQGGLVLQMWQQQPDRLYLTERIYWRPTRAWNLFGFLIADFLPPRGLLADLQGVATKDQTALERFDLTNGQLTVRFQPSKVGDLSLTASHQHTILPSVWWQDWIQKERARLGFSIDGDQPVGTRRTGLRLTGNLRLSQNFAPYLTLRYDRRHGDKADGFEGRAGLKFLFGDSSYADLTYIYRRYFTVENQLVEARCGVALGQALALDAGAAAMYIRPMNLASGDMYLDFNGALWLELGQLSQAMTGLRLAVQYQAFLEPGIFYQLGLMRVSYRYRT